MTADITLSTWPLVPIILLVPNMVTLMTADMPIAKVLKDNEQQYSRITNNLYKNINMIAPVGTPNRVKNLHFNFRQ
jgi:hypothetical protein